MRLDLETIVKNLVASIESTPTSIESTPTSIESTPTAIESTPRLYRVPTTKSVHSTTRPMLHTNPINASQGNSCLIQNPLTASFCLGTLH